MDHRASPVSNTLISICIPTYKRTKFLAACLDSCRAQEDANIEIFVHDDTPDSSVESVVKDYSDLPIRYLRNDPPLGLVGKLNNFLSITRGEWALVLCDDDILLPGFLSTVRRQIAQNPLASSVRCTNLIIDKDGQKLRTDRASPLVSDKAAFIEQLFSPNSAAFTINLTGFAFRPSQLRELGGFTPCHKAYLSDRFALLKLAGVGTAICDPAPLCGIRRHGESISSGFDLEYVEAIASVRQLESEASALLERLELGASTDEQTAQVQASRSALNGWVDRNLTRAIDRAYLAMVSSPGKIPAENRASIKETMRLNTVRRFASYKLYTILARLPEALRVPMARRFIATKQRLHR